MSLIPLTLGYSAMFAAITLTAGSLQDLELRKIETQQVADALALRSVGAKSQDSTKLALDLERFWQSEFQPTVLTVDSSDGGLTLRVRFCRSVQPWALAWLDNSITQVQVCAESLAREVGLGTNSGM